MEVVACMAAAHLGMSGDGQQINFQYPETYSSDIDRPKMLVGQKGERKKSRRTEDGTDFNNKAILLLPVLPYLESR